MSIVQNISHLLAQKDWHQAEAILKEAATRRGASASVFYTLAKVYEAQGKDADMIPSLRKALAVDPNHAMAWYELGRAQMTIDPIAAEKSFTRAAKLSPGDQDCWRHLARLRLRLHDYEGCFRALNELPEDTETMAMAFRVTCELAAKRPIVPHHANDAYLNDQSIAKA